MTMDYRSQEDRPSLQSLWGPDHLRQRQEDLLRITHNLTVNEHDTAFVAQSEEYNPKSFDDVGIHTSLHVTEGSATEVVSGLRGMLTQIHQDREPYVQRALRLHQLNGISALWGFLATVAIYIVARNVFEQTRWAVLCGALVLIGALGLKLYAFLQLTRCTAVWRTSSLWDPSSPVHFRHNLALNQDQEHLVLSITGLEDTETDPLYAQSQPLNTREMQLCQDSITDEIRQGLISVIREAGIPVARKALATILGEELAIVHQRQEQEQERQRDLDDRADLQAGLRTQQLIDQLVIEPYRNNHHQKEESP